MTRSAATQTEGQLVRLAVLGDSAAFAGLYRANVGVVRRVVRSGIDDREAAADLVQEVFARALERLGSLRDPDRFRPWVLAIARHAVVDRHRSQSRAVVGSLDDDRSLDQPGAGPSTEDLAELAELARLVAACVAGLTRRDALAVSLVTHQGQTPAEVALALGVTPATARVVVHRARSRLRDALAFEVMVRRRGRGCPVFAAIDVADVLGAARHLHGCRACTRLVAAQVAV